MCRHLSESAPLTTNDASDSRRIVVCSSANKSEPRISYKPVQVAVASLLHETKPPVRQAPTNNATSCHYKSSFTRNLACTASVGNHRALSQNSCLTTVTQQFLLRASVILKHTNPEHQACLLVQITIQQEEKPQPQPHITRHV